MNNVSKILGFLVLLLVGNSMFSQNKNNTNKVIDSLYLDFENRLQNLSKENLILTENELKKIISQNNEIYKKEITELNNSILTNTGWLIGIFSLVFTIIFALSIINIFNKNKEIKNEVLEFKKDLNFERENLKKKIAKENEEKNQVKELINKIETTLKANDKNLNLLNEERIAFLEFNEDLMQFLEVMSLMLSHNNKELNLLDDFNTLLYEHGNILNLYSNDEESIYKTCQYLKEKGTIKSLKHLNYVKTKFSDKKELYKAIDLAICGIKYREQTA